jgi:hypothetical protein
LKITPPRRDFKERFGQANHFLITTLVGLAAIEDGTISSKGESFSTSWNPKDSKASAHRARIFVLKSFLISAVEALEMYMSRLNKKPKLLQSENFSIIFSKAGQSIYEKVTGIGDEIKVDEVLIGMMEILVTWRNHIAHYNIDNKMRDRSWGLLKEKCEEIKLNFNGLEIDRLRETWEQNKDFSFKETASLIKATQLFVEQVDKYVIENINLELYVQETLERYFENQLFVQRFKSSSKKEIYLSQVIDKQIGLKNYEVKKGLVNYVIAISK